MRRGELGQRDTTRLVRVSCGVILLALVTGCSTSTPRTESSQSGRTTAPASPATSRPSLDSALLAYRPAEAVRGVYDALAKGTDPIYVCGRFTQHSRHAFAVHLGYPDCRTAARALAKRVTDAAAYASSIPSALDRNVSGDRVTIRSCHFGVQGGPALGTFVVTQVSGNQWLITGHQDGPQTCTTPPS